MQCPLKDAALPLANVFGARGPESRFFLAGALRELLGETANGPGSEDPLRPGRWSETRTWLDLNNLPYEPFLWITLMPEFDAYLMVDWSASSKPTRGTDSVWYCLLTRKNSQLSITALENPATRCRAGAEVKELLRDMVPRGQSALAGYLARDREPSCGSRR